MFIYHLTAQADWQHAVEQGEYRAASLHEEGFIHASTYQQVAATANRYYAGKTDLVLLKIDTDRLASTLKFELSTYLKEEFPHIYGALNLDAVVECTAYHPDAQGKFQTPTP